jgi:hypothetical protein
LFYRWCNSSQTNTLRNGHAGIHLSYCFFLYARFSDLTVFCTLLLVCSEAYVYCAQCSYENFPFSFLNETFMHLGFMPQMAKLIA